MHTICRVGYKEYQVPDTVPGCISGFDNRSSTIPIDELDGKSRLILEPCNVVYTTAQLSQGVTEVVADELVCGEDKIPRLLISKHNLPINGLRIISRLPALANMRAIMSAKEVDDKNKSDNHITHERKGSICCNNNGCSSQA